MVLFSIHSSNFGVMCIYASNGCIFFVLQVFQKPQVVSEKKSVFENHEKRGRFVCFFQPQIQETEALGFPMKVFRKFRKKTRTWMSREVSKWLGLMPYNLVINGVYWGDNPLTNHLLTSWDIQVVTRTPN